RGIKAEFDGGIGLDIDDENVRRVAVGVKAGGLQRAVPDAATEHENGIGAADRFIDDPNAGEPGEERASKVPGGSSGNNAEQDEDENDPAAVTAAAAVIIVGHGREIRG